MNDQITLAVSELLGTTREWFDRRHNPALCEWCESPDHTGDTCLFRGDWPASQIGVQF